MYTRVPSHAPSWVFSTVKDCFCQAVRGAGFEGSYRSKRLSSRERLVAVLSEVIRWHQNGLSGVTALIRVIKVVMQTAAFLSAQGGANN